MRSPHRARSSEECHRAMPALSARMAVESPCSLRQVATCSPSWRRALETAIGVVEVDMVSLLMVTIVITIPVSERYSAH